MCRCYSVAEFGYGRRIACRGRDQDGLPGFLRDCQGGSQEACKESADQSRYDESGRSIVRGVRQGWDGDGTAGFWLEASRASSCSVALHCCIVRTGAYANAS